MMILLQVIAGLIVLGVLVFIHETGHFSMAKAFHIRVLAFAIGFGKPLLKKTVGETEYRICMIPFGGYVQMAGEHPEEGHVPAEGDFNLKPVWQRALVAFAGPFANFIFALIFLWIMFTIGVEKPVYLSRPVIGAVADSSVAFKAGLVAGDSIVSISGQPVVSWEDVQSLLSSKSGMMRVLFVRGDRMDSVSFESPAIRGRGIPRHPASGLYAPLPAVIGSVNENSPALKAGIKAGDTVISISSQPVYSWFGLSEIIMHYKPEIGPLSFKIKRTGSTLTIAIAPEYKKDAGRFLIGAAVASPETKKVSYALGAGFFQTLHKSWEYTTMIFDVFGKLFSKQVSPQQLAGPVGIVQMTGLVAMNGISAILDFMALIGINLAVLNLLPLVITDGGLLFFLLIEAIRRKPLSLNTQSIINRIAVAFFITLFLYVTFNDILRIPELLRLGR
jgi:regulator of sigma E protease